MKQTYPAWQLTSGSRVMLMRASKTNIARCILASLVSLLAVACLGAMEGLAADEARQPIPIRFSFDRPVNASVAPFIVAAESPGTGHAGS